MRVIIDGWSARVPRNLALLYGHKRHWRARLKGIVDLEGVHYATLTVFSKVWCIVCLDRCRYSSGAQKKVHKGVIMTLLLVSHLVLTQCWPVRQPMAAKARNSRTWPKRFSALRTRTLRKDKLNYFGERKAHDHRKLRQPQKSQWRQEYHHFWRLAQSQQQAD